MWGEFIQPKGNLHPLMLYARTRLFAILAGALCVVYVNWTLELSGHVRTVLARSATVTVLAAAVLTTLLAWLLSRNLCRFLHRQAAGLPTTVQQQAAAARQAVLFPQRIAFWELVIDPWITIAPICASLWFADIPLPVLLQVCVAGFIGLSCIILTTYLFMESRMQPVVRELFSQGASISFSALPQFRLARRLELGFGATILVTAVMIGGLGMARSREILKFPDNAEQAVGLLRQQTLSITVIAMIVGLAYSRFVARSVTTRVATLVEAMQRVEQGDFQQEICPTGTDEIDRLARQFNGMVRRLACSDRELRDLNASLEHAVDLRTQQLQESLSRLQEVDQLKTNFFSNVSHELRTPLLMILSPLEQLRSITANVLSGDDQGLLHVAEINARRLLTLINHLLEFSRIEAGQFRLRLAQVDVYQRVSQLVHAAQPLATQRGLSLSFERESKFPCIIADASKLEIIATNLISNAIKFTPAGGRVVVRLTDQEPAAEGVALSVEDDGIGISASDCQRLFERFSQLDQPSCRDFPGTGLGLALVRELAELHGGEVSVGSVPGKGTVFTVLLPRGDNSRLELQAGSVDQSNELLSRPFAELERVDLEQQSPETAPLSEERPTILVVDDNIEVRQLLRRLLQSRFAVIEAADGEAGCELALRHRPDCIVSDVMMPRMNGHEFCQRMKSDPQTALIPFMLLTARVGTERTVEGLDVGADDYLCKPFEADELFARIRALLRLGELHRELVDRNSALETALSQNQAMQEQLIRTEKLTSLGQLVAGLAHEVNNSINPVCAGTEVLHRRLQRLGNSVDVSSPESALLRKTLELTEVISQGAHRTARIVRDMRRFAHPGCGVLQQMNLRATIQTCLSLLQLRYPHIVVVDGLDTVDEFIPGIVIATQFAPQVPRVGPYSQLDQVVLNILENGIQELGSEGRIDIVTSESATGWRIKIRDNGRGTPEAIRTRIFDPFFTTKEPGSGTGLGLAISHRIVESLGGILSVESIEGEYTEFTISSEGETLISEKFSPASLPEPALTN